MYNTTQAYKDAMSATSRTTKVNGIIGADIDITNDDIVQGSLSISSQCVDSTDLTLGAVYDSEMCISIYYEGNYQKLNGKIIQLFFSVLTNAENDTWATIPLGLYEITEAKREMTVVKLRARDNLIHFDKEFVAPDTSSRTPYNWLVYICNECGVTLGMTEQEMSAFPNVRAYSMDALTVISTYRNAISYLATISGCFAYIDRLGRLMFKQITVSSSVLNISQSLRKSTTVEDSTLQFVAVTMTKGDKQYGSTVSGNGKCLNLGNMPLLEDFVNEQTEYETACANILARTVSGVTSGLSTVIYSPFTVQWVGDPALDVGDFITIEDVKGEDGSNIDVTNIITNHTWVWRGTTTLKAVGTIEKDVNANNSTTNNTQQITQIYSNLANYATKAYVDAQIGEAIRGDY